jgi:uncharacterized membrane protein YkgB
MLHSIQQHIAKAHQYPAEARQPGPEPRRPASGAWAEEHPVSVAGRQLVRYGLVVVIAWIGALKYSAYEAAAIHPLIANSPLMSWFYNILSVRALAATLGTLEIIAAALIALRVLSPRLSAIGSAMAVLLFLGTLSLLFTTPGVTAGGGFPVLSVLPGQFLLKDLVLLGASLWTLGDSLGAMKSRTKSAVPRQRDSER